MSNHAIIGRHTIFAPFTTEQVIGLLRAYIGVATYDILLELHAGSTYSELADKYRMTCQCLRTKVHRARRKLKKAGLDL